MARPPKPMEVKRATGRRPGVDSAGRKLPELAAVTPLPMARRTPEPPEDLGEDGIQLWNRAWGWAITWLSPDSDLDAIISAARLADDLATARRRYRATTDPSDGRIVVNLSKSFSDALAALGFSPVSRSRLGVAEVKAVSALDQLISRRAERERKAH